MEQHAIPQQISSYEFKLVGDMTLKQFLKAAGGIIIAILIKNTGLIALIKWPLMFVFGGLGLALAFLPLEDRPLETWIISFIKSIYAPTIFIYNKKNDNSWLGLPHIGDEISDGAKPKENKNLFVSVKKQTTEGTMAINKKNVFTQSTGLNKNEEEVLVKKDTQKLFPTKTEISPEKETVLETKKEIVEEINTQQQTADLNIKRDKLEATGQAVFGSIPMPNRPDTANIVVGMATNWDGKIVDGVIIEIQDEHGIPTRVIKTNSLGQFKISTPLANGRYLIIAEKEGYNFDRVNVDLSGQIVEPIKIIAQN
jgi:hypothetical protein